MLEQHGSSIVRKIQSYTRQGENREGQSPMKFTKRKATVHCRNKKMNVVTGNCTILLQGLNYSSET